MKYLALSAISAAIPITVRALDAQACPETKGSLSVIARPLQNWIINSTGQPLPSWGCYVTQFVTLVAAFSLIAGAGFLPYWLSKKSWGGYAMLTIILLIPLVLIVTFVYQLINP